MEHRIGNHLRVSYCEVFNNRIQEWEPGIGISRLGGYVTVPLYEVPELAKALEEVARSESAKPS